MDDLRYWVAFNRTPGVGTAKIRALVDHFGNLQAAWHAGEAEWKAAGLDRRAIESLRAVRAKMDLDAEFARVSACGARLVTWSDREYPPLLHSIPDAPPLLYVKGEFVGGCDIVREMFQAGELQQTLKDKGVMVKQTA